MPEINKIRPIENFNVIQSINGSSKDKKVKKRKQSQDQNPKKQDEDTNNLAENMIDDETGDSSIIDFCA